MASLVFPMTDILKQNLDRLSARYTRLSERIETVEPDPFLRFGKARNGRPTADHLDVSGDWRAVHSAYDPEKEADVWVRQQTFPLDRPLILLGIGLGYHLSALLRLYPGISVLAVENRTALFDHALKSTDLTGIIDNPKVELAVGLENWEVVRRARALYPGAFPDRFTTAAVKPVVACDPGYYRNLAEMLAARDGDWESDRVAIVIASRNRPGPLAVCISSICSQTYRAWDLVLVDDGSERISEFQPIRGLSMLLPKKGNGFSVIISEGVGNPAAQNMALNSTSQPFLLRVDDDSWLEPDYVARLVSTIKTSTDVAAVGGLVPLVFDDLATLRTPPAEARRHGGRLLDRDGRIVALERQSFLEGGRKPYEVDHLRGNFIYRRSALKQIGGFSTAYKPPLCLREETDVTVRLRLAGHKLLVETRAISWHVQHLTGGARDGLDEDGLRKESRSNEETFQRRIRELLDEDGGGGIRLVHD